MKTDADIPLDFDEGFMAKRTTQTQQQQQMPIGANTPAPPSPTVQIELRAMEGTTLPARRRTPRFLPLIAPLPRPGDVIYLNSTSAWGVRLVVHEWSAPDDLRVVVWIEFVGPTHHASRPSFDITQ